MTWTLRHFAKPAEGSAATALAAPAIDMIIDLRCHGAQSWFLMAQDNGCFDPSGIKMTMAQANGSGSVGAQVARGTYDLGFGDVNALTQPAATNPDEALISVHQLDSKTPFAGASRPAPGKHFDSLL
ncbi:MAG: hypothetical protein AAGI03_01710 [Pseudomonadota bacterium]